MRNKQVFTLVELMVVAIIVAILAAVAIPLMTGNVQRAIATEAEAALGTIRSSLRGMYAETRDYTDTGSYGDGTLSNGDDVLGNVPGFQDGDLDGRYFSDECYEVRSVSSDAYVIECDGLRSTADEQDKVNGTTTGNTTVDNVVITINEEGDIAHESGL